MTFHPPAGLPPERRTAALESINYARNLRHARDAAEAVRRRILGARQGVEFYTPETLRRFIEWEGEGCAFPLCEESQAVYGFPDGTDWHLCFAHRRRLMTALQNCRNRRRKHSGTTAGTDTGT